MGLFDRNSRTGGFMDEIRCDESSYLIWKWHPAGVQLGEGNRENAIRWGSSLRVKDGEVAVFVYNQKNGTMQDFIEGPFDQIIKTSNFPVLASIVGLAYEGGTPFQADVYFINLACVVQIPFAVPYFDIYDPRYLDFGVPTAVRGRITFNIGDYKEFIKLHRLANFDLDAFQTQIKDAMARYVKGIVTNAPAEKNIPVVQIERAITSINEMVEASVKDRFESDFGVNITGVDINAIEVDKSSVGYKQLKAVTQDLAAATVQAQSAINIKNMEDMQRINAENMEETMRVQREEAQYAQHKQTQTGNFAAYQLEQQAAVGIAGAEALGNMGANGATEMSGAGGGGGMDPAAMMAGMAVGGAVGQNIAGTMNNMMQGVNGSQQLGQEMPQQMTPPPIPNVAYSVVQNGQAAGPFDMNGLSQMVAGGTLTKDSLVWKQGMADWACAGTVQELTPLFGATTPPPIPPVPTEE
jgi:membrane protease subunit (stomatin/prohibitin family)